MDDTQNFVHDKGLNIVGESNAVYRVYRDSGFSSFAPRARITVGDARDFHGTGHACSR